MKFKSHVFVHTFLPLILGFCIYILFKSPKLSLKAFFFHQSPFKIHVPNNIFFNQFKHNLPDGLWSYSLMSLIILVVGNPLTKQNVPWIVCALIFPIIFEMCQYLKWIRGTFDSLDLIYSITFSLGSIFFLTSKFLNDEKQKQF
ncbi:MAG: hypothetical protein QM539_05110 [Alphaproteobacteria bacterium]|nr:hypothetical protein [Alphaproteobacteria bacterium]